MTTLLTSELIDRCHAGSRAKGFWDETPPKGQQLMLVISELAEALEADRKGRHADFSAYGEAMIRQQAASVFAGQFCAPIFERLLKDTVGDELADAYIRLCDFIGGYGLDAAAVIESKNEWDGIFGAAGSCLGEALLSISHTVSSAWTDDVEAEAPIGYAMSELEALAERFGIDLATHIDLKLRYNATRPAKHGKAY